MSLTIKNWKKQVEEMPSDAAVCITYIQLSEFNGYGLYVSIIPPGEANTGHYHPREPEKYHIVKGRGVLMSQPVCMLENSAPVFKQDVQEGMTADIPGMVVHRLYNNSKEPLVFLFECPVAHMDKENPIRTAVPGFGGI